MTTGYAVVRAKEAGLLLAVFRPIDLPWPGAKEAQVTQWDPLKRSVSATMRFAGPVSVGRRLAGMSPVIAQCGLAAVVAWWLADILLGHQQPVFAATAAVICLAGGKGQRARQAVDLLAGVLSGVFVGEIIRRWGPDDVLLRVAIAVVFGMVAATVLDPRALAYIQGASSALFVLVLPALQDPGGRFLDAAIGGGLGLLGSQLLFTPDPVAMMVTAARRVFSSTEEALGCGAQALQQSDAALAAGALDVARGARADMTALAEQRSIAHQIQTRTARGRYRAARIREVGWRMGDLDLLVAATLLLTREAERLTIADELVRQELAAFLDRAADDVAAVSNDLEQHVRGRRTRPELNAAVPPTLPDSTRVLAQMLTAALAGLTDPDSSPM